MAGLLTRRRRRRQRLLGRGLEPCGHALRPDQLGGPVVLRPPQKVSVFGRAEAEAQGKAVSLSLTSCGSQGSAPC